MTDVLAHIPDEDRQPNVRGVKLKRPPSSEAASRAEFWTYVDLLGSCWNWQGVVNYAGYGRVGFGGHQFSAHRCSYEFFHGRVPSSLFVCHHCDNPPCVNPAHLYAGTPKQNTSDMMRRGRNSQGAHVGQLGSANTRARLNEDTALRIREIYSEGLTTQTELGALYGVDASTVGNLVAGRTWKHVGGPIHVYQRSRDER